MNPSRRPLHLEVAITNYAKRLCVEPKSKIKLADYATASGLDHAGRKAAKAELDELHQAMATLQEQLYAERKHSLLVVFQGMDAAGKDGVIKHVFTSLNPQGCSVTSFKQPTPEEQEHDFLWRIHRHAPRRGLVAVFNRSHYEDVLVARVHHLAPKQQWAKRFEQINAFEQLLSAGNSTTILKFFLHISPEEQLKRFKKRLDDPERHWKISEADYSERQYWLEYQEAYEDVLNKTSTKHAPWFIIPADQKWYRNLAVSQIITGSLQGLGLKAPTPTVDLERIRQEYHEAVKSS